MQRSISLEYQIKPPPLMKSDTQVTGMAVAVAEGFAGSGVKLNNC